MNSNNSFSISFLLLFFIAIFNLSLAQSGASVPFLNLQQSPLLVGAGNIGASIISSDPAGFYYNPAQLGNFSRKNTFAVFFMPEKLEWFPNYYPNRFLQSHSAAVGYNFQNDNSDIPLSIGFGYIHNKIDFGELLRLDPAWYGSLGGPKSFDSFDCFSFGASYDYYLQFNVGFALKFFTTKLSHLGNGEEFGRGEHKGTAFDFGMMIITPLSRLLFNDAKFSFIKDSELKPELNMSIGYSITNIGKKVYYFDASQADPLPRTTRLGYSLTLGLKLLYKDLTIDALNYSLTIEAEDLLFRTTNVDNFQYQSLLGDINLFNHLIRLRSDSNVIVHKGHIINFFETVTLLYGSYNDNYYKIIKSTGFALSTEGILRLIDSFYDNCILDYINKHIVIEYINTDFYIGTTFQKNMKGIYFYLKSMEI